MVNADGSRGSFDSGGRGIVLPQLGTIDSSASCIIFIADVQDHLIFQPPSHTGFCFGQMTLCLGMFLLSSRGRKTMSHLKGHQTSIRPEISSG